MATKQVSEGQQCIKRLRHRLDRWELPHLRELAARLATELEEMTERAERAESEASMAWRDAEQAHELLREWANEQPGTSIGMTVDGTMHVLQGGAA